MNKPLPVIFALLTGLICQSIGAEKLTVDRIFSSPSLAGESLRGLKVSPDGTRVTFLKGKEQDYERFDLWEYHIESQQTRMLFNSDDLHSGTEQLSDEEKARRERLRLSGSGIVDYTWSNDGQSLIFPLAGDIFYWRVGDAKARKLIQTPEFETDVQFSPKGNYVSYIREQNIFAFDLNKNKEMQLTYEGKGAIKMGMAEFVAQEEMGRMTGYWWSPDEAHVAFLKVDESPVAEVTRSEIYADKIDLIQQRYPFAGKNNVLIDLGIVSLAKKKIKWIDLGKEKDIYIARVNWNKDSSKLSYQWQSRDQQLLELRQYQLADKAQSLLLKEASNTWINLHDNLRFLKDGSFFWSSEKDGFSHIYWHKSNGELIKQITAGEWVVEDIKAINQDTSTLYFSGRKDTPLERHLYAVNYATEAPMTTIERLSSNGAYHNVTFAPTANVYIDSFSSEAQPPQVALFNAKGERLAWLSENAVDKNHPLFAYLNDWITPEFGSITTEDKAKLYYRLYKPHNFKASKKYPAIVYLYGGPHAQMVTNSWGRLNPQYWAQQGYAVFTLDNRGSNFRGKAFEEPIHKAMGQIEVTDQIAGVKFLRSLNWIDESKIGVHGHSYGGYMTLMTMFKAGDYFSAGVAGAPVTDWSLYDTHYTERYMGHPQKDADAYEKSSVFPYATQLKGELLIYHGMADDNVLFTNATRLYKLLQDNNIPFFVMDYPGKKHSIRGKETQKHLLNTITRFFDLQFGVKR